MCRHTSSRALSSGLGRPGPAVGGNLPSSCTQRWSISDKTTTDHSGDSDLSGHSVLPGEDPLIGHIRNLLCSAEGQVEVFSGLGGVECCVLELVGEEAVHQGAEGYAVFPA